VSSVAPAALDSRPYARVLSASAHHAVHMDARSLIHACAFAVGGVGCCGACCFLSVVVAAPLVCPSVCVHLCVCLCACVCVCVVVSASVCLCGRVQLDNQLLAAQGRPVVLQPLWQVTDGPGVESCLQWWQQKAADIAASGSAAPRQSIGSESATTKAGGEVQPQSQQHQKHQKRLKHQPLRFRGDDEHAPGGRQLVEFQIERDLLRSDMDHGARSLLPSVGHAGGGEGGRQPLTRRLADNT
jgi:hypothetical protein